MVLLAFLLGDKDAILSPLEKAGESLPPVLLTNFQPRRPKPKKKVIRKRPVKRKVKPISGPPSILGPEDTSLGYTYQNSIANLSHFDIWLKSLIDKEILQTTTPLSQMWLVRPLGAAYKKGALAVRNQVTRQLSGASGLSLPPSSPLTNPYHIQRASTLYVRAFNGMEGVTGAMRTQMRRVLADGMLRGASPITIGRELANQIDSFGWLEAGS
jgi:hypothetical protein